MSKEVKPKIVNVKVEVMATAMGYYKGRIIRDGQKFVYEGALKDGKLPLWVSKIGEQKIVADKPKKVEAEETNEDSDSII